MRPTLHRASRAGLSFASPDLLRSVWNAYALPEWVFVATLVHIVLRHVIQPLFLISCFRLLEVEPFGCPVGLASLKWTSDSNPLVRQTGSVSSSTHVRWRAALDQLSRAGVSRESLLRLSVYALIPSNHLERCRTLFSMFPNSRHLPVLGRTFLIASWKQASAETKQTG